VGDWLASVKSDIFAGLNSFAAGSRVEIVRGEVEVVLREVEWTLGGVERTQDEVEGALSELPSLSGGVYQREVLSPPFPLFPRSLSGVKRRAFASSGRSCRSDL
jgi:hypothetical protein